MSRCFRYPPPGYTLSRSSEDALIESIKLQKEKKQAKERRKERRKEKKERRKEKRERRKEKDQKRKERKEKTNQNSDKHDISKEQYVKDFQANSDHLEKSYLTEEHEQPICLRVPSTSSESTENNIKRKRDISPVDGRHGHGNIIRIRMASKKQNLSNSSIDEHLCSTSGNVPAQNKDAFGHKNKQEAIYIPTEGTRIFDQGLTAGTEKELLSLISKNDSCAPGITGASTVPVAVMSSIKKRELKYNKLIEMWLPPQLEDTCLDTDDLDWLFNCNNQGIRDEKRLKSECNSISCSSSSIPWQPHARILPEVDVYALPFTVPFA